MPVDMKLSKLLGYSTVKCICRECIARCMNEVTERVYIGDVDAAAAVDSDEFDSVITVAEPELPTTTAYYPLVDGDNEQSEFNNAVDAVRDALQDGDRVLVHCTLGISRSAGVLSAALAAERDLRYDEALNMIRSVRPSANPAHELTKLAKAYLGETDGRPFQTREE